MCVMTVWSSRRELQSVSTAEQEEESPQLSSERSAAPSEVKFLCVASKLTG